MYCLTLAQPDVDSIAQYEVFLRLMGDLVIMDKYRGGSQLAGNQFRQKYIDHAESLFPIIAALISDDLPDPLQLTTILEPQLQDAEAWYGYPGRLVEWDWRTILHKFRKKPKRLDVAFYCKDVLCGLMTASISRGRVGINIRYVEGNPDPTHPLKRNFLYLALWQAELFGTFSDCKRVTVSQPNPFLVESYKALGYGMVDSDLKREMKSIPPKHALLVKHLRDVAFDPPAQLA